MVEVLSKDELKELKELSDRVTPAEYIYDALMVLRRLRHSGVYRGRLYTGTDLLMMVGRSLLKELRRTV